MTKEPVVPKADPTPGAVYDEYDGLVQRVERWIDGRRPVAPGCEDAHVRARLVQRVVQITVNAFTLQALQRGRQASTSHLETWGADSLTVDASTGRVRLGAKQWFNNIAHFGYVWLDTLVRLAGGCFLRAPNQSTPATVLMEASGYEESDERLAGFCRRGPVEPLARSAAVIVQSRTPPRQPVASHLRYSRHPFVYLANHLLTRTARVALVFRHLTAPLLYARAIVACRLNVLLGRDFALLPAIAWLDDRRYLESVIITTSSFMSQPLWAKGRRGQRTPLEMIWYSQNCIPKMYPGDARRPDLPSMRHMRVDVHWVWTQGFGQYLRELGQQGQIRVVGPLLWYLPEDASTGLPKADLKVALFDITPLPEGKTAFGASRNYYTVALMKKFVTDIIEACEDAAGRNGRTVYIAIKHKRAPLLTYHDTTYLDFLEALVAAKPHVAMIDPHVNLYGLMGECDLSVSVPYTSTAYLSAALGKPAVYYDPFAEIVPQFEASPLVHFASGRGELRDLVAGLLNPASRTQSAARAN